MSFIKSLALFGLIASPATAFWRLPCKDALVVERADPIVNPGAVAGHLHTIMGGNGFDVTMDYNSTQSSTCTSCTVKGDMSNYWVPVLYFKHKDGTFEKVNQLGGALVYYLQRGKKGEKLEAFPEGFRMLAGDAYKRSGGSDFPSQAVSYNCLDYTKGNPETNEFPKKNCPNGLRAQIFFPACWDGKNLDSADHKSHMSYPIQNFNNGDCPSSHPVHMVSLFYEVIWDTNPFAGQWSGNEQPFVWSTGDSTGYGYHGDFVNGWDVDLLQRAIDTCTNDSGRVEDCGAFSLYSDATAQACKKKSSIDEVISVKTDKLPGCNPVTGGPGPAQKATDCTSPNVNAGIGAGAGTGAGAGSGSSGSGSGSSASPSSSKAANNGAGAGSGAATSKAATTSQAGGQFYQAPTSKNAAAAPTDNADKSNNNAADNNAATKTSGSQASSPAELGGSNKNGACGLVATVTETITNKVTVTAAPIADSGNKVDSSDNTNNKQKQNDDSQKQDGEQDKPASTSTTKKLILTGTGTGGAYPTDADGEYKANWKRAAHLHGHKRRSSGHL